MTGITTIGRKASSKLLVSLVLFIALAAGHQVNDVLASDNPGPNIVLILIDTLRADHLGCYGYKRNTSPNIDDFASEAVVYKNAIATSSWTSPAVASLFTAQYPHVMGYEDQAVVLDEKFLTIAEILRNHGYATRGVISHLYLSADLGFDQGFETFDEENAQGHGHISSPSVTDKGIELIDELKDENFFLFLHYFDPHCDYILHDEYDFYPDYAGSLYSGETIQDLRAIARDMNDDDVRYLNALYDSEIKFTDQHIGRLLDHLKATGLYDDALIVIVADHGEEFLERGNGWIGHTRTVYQELVHVPFMIRLPGGQGACTVERPVSLLDFMPTVVASAGLEVPPGYEHDGVRIDTSGEGEYPRSLLVTETRRWGTQQGVIEGSWKLLHDPTNRTFSLYDLKADPGELKDVSAANEETFRRLKSALFEWDYDVRMKRSKFRVRHPNLSRQQVEKLKSLGYIR
jgi:arylsulfatase A-like enzyme